ncbi:MAG: hypothetical protein ACRD0H_22145, partial [Actinomycetes bacterium]
MTNHSDGLTAVTRTDRDEELAAEQDYVSMLYRQLDERRRYTAGRLAEVLRAATTGTPQGRSERDVAAAMSSDQLVALDGGEQGLCFGRLDLDGTSEGDVLR